MTSRDRIAVASAVLAMTATVAFSVPARAESVSVIVIAAARPPWLANLIHELEAAGFDPRTSERSADERWAVRAVPAPAEIEVLSRASGGGDWIVDERVPLGRTVIARRRAIVRAVEILRTRHLSASLAVQPATASHGAIELGDSRSPPLPKLPPAPLSPPLSKTPPPPQRPIAKIDVAPKPRSEASISRGTRGGAQSDPHTRRAPRTPEPFSLGVTASLGGAAGGLGFPVALGLVGRWTGRRLSLWSRGETSVFETTVTGAEGRARIRNVAMSLGAGWSLRDDDGSARWLPFLGAEATGLLIRATGEASPGYRGQTIVVPGLSLGALAGIRVSLGRRLALVAQGRAGIVACEPVVTFAGRRVAAWQGLSLGATTDLSWRF